MIAMLPNLRHKGKSDFVCLLCFYVLMFVNPDHAIYGAQNTKAYINVGKRFVFRIEILDKRAPN